MKAAPATRKVTAAALRAWSLPDPHSSESKEDRGTVLVVAGSRQIPGAALLAANAALHAGAGKLQLATAAEVAVALAVAIPEAKVLSLRSDRRGEIAHSSAELNAAVAGAEAVLVGPGMLASAATRRVIRTLMSSATGTVVLDAGAMEAHATATNAGALILTPHIGEMASLLDTDAERIKADPAKAAMNLARSSGAVLVLKGPTTFIAAPDGRLWIHEGGCVGLGTSGSGDVLAGIIAGLAARGARPEQAAVWGVFVHARAGTILSRLHGVVGFLARQISAEVPAILTRIHP